MKVMLMILGLYAAITAQIAWADHLPAGASGLLLPCLAVLLLTRGVSPGLSVVFAAAGGAICDLLAGIPLGPHIAGFALAAWVDGRFRREAGTALPKAALGLFVALLPPLVILQVVNRWSVAAHSSIADDGLGVLAAATLGTVVAVVLFIAHRSAGFLLRGWQQELGFHRHGYSESRFL